MNPWPPSPVGHGSFSEGERVYPCCVSHISLRLRCPANIFALFVFVLGLAIHGWDAGIKTDIRKIWR